MLSIIKTPRFGVLPAKRAFSGITSGRLALSAPTLNRAAFRLQTRYYSPITQDPPCVLKEYEDVKKLVETPNPNVVIVDVREPAEYAEGHIPTAINIPFKSSPGALGLDAEEFQDVFGFEKPETDKNVLFYCLAGVRSSAAEGLAATFGYQKRANYKGSYEDWVKHGGEIEV